MRRSLIAVVTFFGCCAGVVLAEWKLTDSFDTHGSRVVGEKLHQSSAQSRNATWDSTVNLLFGEKGGKGFLTAQTGSLYVAKVEAPTEGNVYRMESVAYLPVGEGANTAAYTCVGIGSPKPFNITWLGGVYVSLNAKGQASVSIHPDFHQADIDPNRKGAVQIKAVKLMEFKAEQSHKLVLEYDKKNNTVSAWVDDGEVLMRYSLEKHSFVPSTEYLGFSGFGFARNEAIIDQFAASVQ